MLSRVDRADNSSSSSSEEASTVKPWSALAAAAAAASSRCGQIRGQPSQAEIDAALAYETPRDSEAKSLVRESRYIGRLVERAEERKEEARKIAEKRCVDAEERPQFVTKRYADSLQGIQTDIPHRRRRRSPLTQVAPPLKTTARRSRFGDAKLFRGLRRNDESDVEAYRQRYHAREQERAVAAQREG